MTRRPSPVAQGRRRKGSTWARWLRSVTSTVAVGAVTLGGLVVADFAAASTVYEIEGEWQAPVPRTIADGESVSSVWHVNVNDDSPAPSNDPVDNVTITFTAQKAKFETIPDICLRRNVTPVSSISDDGETLICNLGTRNQGTADLILTGLVAYGYNGDLVSISAEIGGNTAVLPEILIDNAFRMDMKFDGGNPYQKSSGALEELAFPWSLRHSSKAEAGPDSVSYDLTFRSSAGNLVTPRAPACIAQSYAQPDHPFSTPGEAPEKTAPFPASCTLVSTGANTMRLTLTGIDYSKTILPSLDSAGTPLPKGWDVIAAGLLVVQFTYTSSSVTDVTASAPTYQSVSGKSSTDDPSNNSNSVSSIRGSYTGGWALNFMVPAQQGTLWTDTFRTVQGASVRSLAGVRGPNAGATDPTQLCQVLDPRHVTLADTAMGSVNADGSIARYAGIQYNYYLGSGTDNVLDPASPNYDPNKFKCNDTVGTWSGWTGASPADLGMETRVRAILARISPAAGANIPVAVPLLFSDLTIKPGTPVGQDIWTWMSYSYNGGASWTDVDRGLTDAEVRGNGVLTPNSRYPFTGVGRDVLRIVDATPVLSKTVDELVTVPGAQVNYTLTYSAEAVVSTTVEKMTIVDILPPGVDYVPGSALPAPTSVNGRTLTWELTDVPTHTDFVITYGARLPATADAQQTFTNQASATISGATARADAVTQIRDGGYTMLTKTADQPKVPQENGVAEGSWTVRVSSQDTRPQAFTDVVDVLPFNGDGRGTDFSGSYELSAPPNAVAGATVYYTTADPTTVADDPADPSNGASGDVTGNTVGWTSTFLPDATAVRVIGPALPAMGQQEFVISVVTEGASFEDVYVNRAEARAERSVLTMRTSGRFEIAGTQSVLLKKYVQDEDGDWRDANDVDDFPQFHTGSTLSYRLVVTNTGDQTLNDLSLHDDKVDISALDPMPDGLEPDGSIKELLAGDSVTIEYEVPLTAIPAGGQLVNTACVEAGGPTVPAALPPASCDPAGVEVLPSSLSWTKVAEGTTARLDGSEWQLTLVDEDGDPIGTELDITDCVADDVSECTGPDLDPAAGGFTVSLDEDGRYRLVETRAPAGYQLDASPHYIRVQGVTAFAADIENAQVPALLIPFTGGLGAFGFWIGSAALTLLVLFSLFWQRRRRVMA